MSLDETKPRNQGIKNICAVADITENQDKSGDEESKSDLGLPSSLNEWRGLSVQIMMWDSTRWLFVGLFCSVYRKEGGGRRNGNEEQRAHILLQPQQYEGTGEEDHPW